MRKLSDKEAQKLAKKEAEQAAKEQARTDAEKASIAKNAETPISDVSELYEGDVQMVIESPSGFKQVNQFKTHLRTIDNLSIALGSWSEDEGFIIVVSLREPMPLGSILSQIPIVEQVYRENKKLVIVLKPPDAS